MKFLLPVEVIKAYGPEITLFWKKAYKDGSEIKWRVFITVNELRDILVGKADTDNEAEKMIDALIKMVKAEKEKNDRFEVIHEKLNMLLDDSPIQGMKENEKRAEERKKLLNTIEYLNQVITKKSIEIEDLKQEVRHKTLSYHMNLKKAEKEEKISQFQRDDLKKQVECLLAEKESLNSPLLNIVAIFVLIFAFIGFAFVIANFAGAVTWKW